jgi:dienelactone hydrolase
MRRLLAALAVTLVAAGGCSDDGGDGDAEATTTTLDPREAATAYAEAGPHPVGVTTLALPSGPAVEVWYPAVEGTQGTETYDARDFVPPAIQSILTGDAPATYTYDAGRDAEAAEGTFPVVLFSHGFAGFRLQTTYLTSHLASQGMVVVAPDHPSRDLFHVLSGQASPDPVASVDDLLGALDLVVAESEEPGNLLEGRIDAARVAALGHSAGGGTALGAALDERVEGYVSLAGGAPEDGADQPARPSFFVAGAVDEIVPADERTRPAFESAPPPARYWQIEAVGHNGFTDFCTFGNGTGIIGVAEASGLGGLLDAQPRLRALGEDGCVPPAAPVEQAFPIVRHGVTAWLRWLFEEDPEPIGLDADVDGAFDLAVTNEATEEATAS